MNILSVFDSNEDITSFVQGKIRVSGRHMTQLGKAEYFFPLNVHKYYVPCRQHHDIVYF